MERVTRKECDTWKIITTAHEAGFILTLVVEILLKIFSAFFALFVFSRLSFLICASSLLTARQATGALKKASIVKTAFFMC